MSYLDWKVGDRVVCIEGVSADVSRWHKPIIAGTTYTISGFYVWNETPGITVLECPNSINRVNGLEFGYEARRFRKVHSLKTDISIFTAMLHDQRQKVPV